MIRIANHTVILHKSSLTGASPPASLLYNLTKNLHGKLVCPRKSNENNYAVLPYKYLDLLDIPTDAIEIISTLGLEKLFVFTSEEVKTYYDNLKGCEKLFEIFDK